MPSTTLEFELGIEGVGGRLLGIGDVLELARKQKSKIKFLRALERILRWQKRQKASKEHALGGLCINFQQVEIGGTTEEANLKSKALGAGWNGDNPVRVIMTFLVSATEILIIATPDTPGPVDRANIVMLNYYSYL